MGPHTPQSTGGRFLTLGAAFPTIGLMLHDLFAYGQAHVTAMMGFQGTSTEGRDFARKLIASIAMLGGRRVLAYFVLVAAKRCCLGLAIGVALGIAGAQLSGQQDAAFWTTILFAGAGGASLGGGLIHRWSDTDTSGWQPGSYLDCCFC